MTRKQTMAAAVGGLITLKLLGFVALSWVWILSPLWVPASLLLMFLIVVFTVLYGSGAR